MAAQVISFQCVLKNRFGRLISETFTRDVIASPETKTGEAAELKALSEALVGLRKGEKKTVVIRAEDAYGFYNPDLVVTRFRSELIGSDDYVVGEVVTYISKGKTLKYRVVESTEHTVTLDANHPLAGEDLVFEIEGMSSREASLDDLGVEAQVTRFH